MPKLTAGRSFLCHHSDCGRGFQKAEHLARHERKHSGAKPFTCPICDRRFSRNDSMVRHSKIHSQNLLLPTATKTAVDVTSQQDHFLTIQPAQQSNDAARTVRTLPTYDGPETSEMRVNGSHPLALDRAGTTETLARINETTGTNVVEGSHHQQRFDQMDLINQSDGFDLGFDWSLSSEDLFNLLRADSTVLPSALPLENFPETQTSMTYDSLAELHTGRDNASGSVDASRRAVRSMNNMIKDLPSKLVAELEGGDKAYSFFDDCLELFFTRFLTAFPILHKPTFVTNDCSSTLLLNMLALGSVFIGSTDAVRRGEALWSLAHAVVATSWQSLMLQRGPRDDRDGVQLVLTAALGQTYALLSRNNSFRMTSQIFHGLGFYWSRHCMMYDTSSLSKHGLPSHNENLDRKTEFWLTWAASETRLRAILGHYILDGQIAQFSGNPTCVRHATNALPIPSTTAAFNATSADAWITEMEKANGCDLTFRDFISALFCPNRSVVTRVTSDFGIRVVLESLQSLILEAAEAGGKAIGTPSRKEMTDALLRLYRWHICPSPDVAELSLRWHSVFLSITIDIGAFCKQTLSCNVTQLLFKPTARSLHAGHLDIHKWVNGVDARRALLHAFAIRDIAQSLPFSRSHAIHMPSTIFAAATIHAAHMAGGVQSVTVPDVVDWDTVWREDFVSQRGSSLDPVEIGRVETGAFLNRSFSPRNPRLLSRKMGSELHALRMQLKSTASQWGISQPMDKVMEQWHSTLR